MAPPRRPWFRFYVEAIHDRKLRRRPASDRWLWVVLLAVARESSVPGMLLIGNKPASLVDLADVAALKEKEVKSGLEYFIGEGMLEGDSENCGLLVAKWHQRQYETDLSTERVARHRESNGDATVMQRPNVVSETPDVTAIPPMMKRRSSRALGTDTENREQKTETDLKANPPVGPPLSEQGTAPAKRRPERIPQNWQPSETLTAWATTNHPGVNVCLETERFTNHAVSTGRTLLDWDAGWRNWVLKAEEIHSQHGNSNGSKPSNREKLLAAMREDGVIP